ncbi:pantoate--beta-alanine ligase [Hyphobacterium marinum]|uniref:Pantothenate synthetase n=1 Tax=Hyphobacterium marinum TaxID=3116574 RepID=A0ABU7M0A7_9PROT|nr:pantoate--beta-alanine ligase [Hyphobacterium sp. Y6023]MEE2566845.1 pantoate--beta-alanine ligase [Hyphobacterium sp. Y6023]
MSDLPHLPLTAVDTPADLRKAVMAWRRAGLKVGFVPTMGALHDGHISLVELALRHCDRVVASVFVNPAQFAPGEDFDAYPRTLETDAAKLAEAHCHLLYAPTARAMYPEGFALKVQVGGPSEGLETDFRPHFFDGVATVVAKLFNQVRPDIAVFGEKDYQQLLVIRRLAADLDHGVAIIPGPVVREDDGLALSSRNVYLSQDERARAVRLNEILKDFAQALERGDDVATAQARALAKAANGFDGVDYVEARCAETLAELPAGPIDRPARVLGAVWLGKTRLIDNFAADPA